MPPFSTFGDSTAHSLGNTPNPRSQPRGEDLLNLDLPVGVARASRRIERPQHPIDLVDGVVVCE